MSAVITEPATTTLRAGAFGNATALACRECGHQLEPGSVLRVSGVLRSAGDLLRLPAGHP